MTDNQKMIIREMRAKGCVYAEIASALHLSVNSVKSLCRRNQILPIEKQSESRPVCKHCGAELFNTPGHRQKTFCSAACRQQYWRTHADLMRHKAVRTMICPICGKSFTDYTAHHRKYCSHACYIQHRYKSHTIFESAEEVLA